MQDDRLDPGCVSAMASLLTRYPSIGFVFSARRLEFDGLAERDAQQSPRTLGVLHRELEPLGEVNDGARIFEVMKSERFRTNHLGEPTVVMVRRSAFQRVGLFNERLGQWIDHEMWLRLAAFHDVGFVREPMATFRVHGVSASTKNIRSGAAWLDRVWVVEGLREHPELRRLVGWRARFRAWGGILKAERRRQAERVRSGHWPEGRRLGRGVLDYFRWLLAPRRPALHKRLRETAAQAEERQN
jgi:hypothetical protein